MSGTTRVSRYQKVKPGRLKPVWIYWSKRQWVAVASAGLYASLHLIPDTHANIPPLSFLQAGCPSCCPTNSIKTVFGWVHLLLWGLGWWDSCLYVWRVRNRLSLTGNHALYLIINKRTVASMSETIGRLYQTEQDEDGFLYVTYTSQEAFGALPLPPVWLVVLLLLACVCVSVLDACIIPLSLCQCDDSYLMLQCSAIMQRDTDWLMYWFISGFIDYTVTTYHWTECTVLWIDWLLSDIVNSVYTPSVCLCQIIHCLVNSSDIIWHWCLY